MVTWPDGTAEHVDEILLATGYRPDVGYLVPVGALDAQAIPVASAASPHPSASGVRGPGVAVHSRLREPARRGPRRPPRRMADMLRRALR